MKLNLKHGLLTGVIALCTGTAAIAQISGGHIHFAWGDEYELPKKHEDLGFVGNSTDGYIQIGHRNHESLTFQKFDNKLHLTGEKETDISDLPRDYSNEWFTQIGDKYYWFFSTWEKSENKEALYAQEMDIKSGAVIGTAREILSTTKLGGTFVATGYFSGHLTDKWNFYSSFDKSKLLIQYRKKPERRNDAVNNDVIGFFVFDANLQKMWGREIRMPYTEKKMDNEDYQVDNRGNVYTLAKVYNAEKGDRHTPDYHFEILRWGNDKPEVTKIPFRFSDKFVNGATVLENPKGEIVVAGYYSMKKHSNSTDGVFLLKLDEEKFELNNIMKGTYEFPVEVLGQFERARARRRLERKDENGDAEASNLVLRDVVINPDGSIKIFGEEFHIEVVTHYTGKTTSTTYYYHYDNILAMNIGADGNLKWVKKVPKSQVSATRSGFRDVQGEMGYKQYTFGKDTYLFFMDRESNMDLDEEHAPDTHDDKARGILVAVKLDENGHMNKQMVYNGREEKVRITPTDFDNVGNNQIIVCGRARRRESQAALITFE